MLWKQDVVTDWEPSTRKLEPTVKKFSQAKGQVLCVTFSTKCYPGQRTTIQRQVCNSKYTKKILSGSFLNLDKLVNNSFWRNCIRSNLEQFGLYSFVRFFNFSMNLLGWHWLINLHRFQVCNSIIRHLYIVLCAHHPKSSLLPSPFIPLYPFLPPPTLFPSG